jgi:hypothetical protein
MRAGQFYSGKIDGIQKYYQTPEILNILPKDKLAELREYTDPGEYPRFFKTEKVLTKTIIRPAENSDGRRGGITNHTVLYKFDQTIEKDTLQYIFPLEDFITEILAGKRRFKMPPLPELTETGIIDYPPAIEWEAT